MARVDQDAANPQGELSADAESRGAARRRAYRIEVPETEDVVVEIEGVEVLRLHALKGETITVHVGIPVYSCTASGVEAAETEAALQIRPARR